MASAARPLPDPDRLGFTSTAVHAGERLPPFDTKPVTTPIYSAVAFEAPSAEALDAVFEGTRPGYCYTRHGNPTLEALEETITRLEHGAGAIAFSSGMAALHAALLTAGVRSGDRVVSSRDIYGATQALFRDVMTPLGIQFCYTNASDQAALTDAIAASRPRVVFVEAISNPLLRVVDLPAVVVAARSAGAAVIVDSTFATPRLLTPISLGADFVVHSTTKYLNGHGDATGGVVVSAAREPLTRLRQVSKLVGGILGPFEAYLTLRGVKTLGLRMPRQCDNARLVAERLAAHPRVERVHYPGLPSHPDFGVASRLLRDQLAGAVVTLALRGAARPEVFRLMDSLRLCCVGTTVGDIYTQMLYPAMSSHRALSAEERSQLGIGDNLVRLSVGIEEPEDVIADLEQALEAAMGTQSSRTQHEQHTRRTSS
ncbi:MAG: trans-sulfuration enzyme family protein [Bacteroidales bacterium]